jgi:hypothetical protein
MAIALRRLGERGCKAFTGFTAGHAHCFVRLCCWPGTLRLPRRDLHKHSIPGLIPQ